MNTKALISAVKKSAEPKRNNAFLLTHICDQPTVFFLAFFFLAFFFLAFYFLSKL